jgi:hypothetical protein
MTHPSRETRPTDPQRTRACACDRPRCSDEEEQGFKKHAASGAASAWPAATLSSSRGLRARSRPRSAQGSDSSTRVAARAVEARAVEARQMRGLAAQAALRAPLQGAQARIMHQPQGRGQKDCRERFIGRGPSRSALARPAAPFPPAHPCRNALRLGSREGSRILWRRATHAGPGANPPHRTLRDYQHWSRRRARGPAVGPVAPT